MAPGPDGQLVKLDSAYGRRKDTGAGLTVHHCPVRMLFSQLDWIEWPRAALFFVPSLFPKQTNSQLCQGGW